MLIDMLGGSVAKGLNASNRFCAGSHILVDHQCIHATSFVFSATVLAVSASESIKIRQNTLSIHNGTCARSARCSTGSGQSRSPRTLPCRSFKSICVCQRSNPATPAARDARSFDIAGKQRPLQDIVDEALARPCGITRARRLRR